MSSRATTVESRPAVIEIRGLTKSFGETVVLRDFSLAVAAGEVVVICGPSGSGKSTLLRCIIGLEPINGGQILVLGEPVESTDAGVRAVCTKVGMVFQAFNLFAHLTVRQNLTLGPVKVGKLPRGEADKRATKMLERVGIYDKVDAFPETLSGGEQQRVAIARALCMEPDVLLLDEPTSSLDPELVNEVLELIRDLALEGHTMIVVSHEMDFARGVADRVVFMDHGKIIEEAPTERLFGSPKEERTREFLSKIMFN